MIRPALVFEEVRVKRMPGFEPPGLGVKELSAGINVIHGPNGSGKSTLARAILELIWPKEAGPRSWLEGRARIEGASWLLEVDAGRSSSQREGIDAELPTRPSSTERDRYLLALDALLQDKNTGDDFAERILRESAGGYDVMAASKALEFDRKLIKVPHAAWSAAKAKVDEAESRQEQLRDEESRLDDLRRKRELAERSRKRVQALKAALERSLSEVKLTTASEALRAFPEVLGRMTGKEWEELSRIGSELETIASGIHEARGRAAAAEKTLEGCRLPPEGVPGGLIASARMDLAELARLESGLQNLEREIASAGKRVEEHGAAIRGALDPVKAAALDLEGLEDLGKLARDAEEVRARREALVQTERLLAGPPPGDANRLRDGVRLLERWLREPPPGGPPRAPALLALAGAILLGAGIVLAALRGPIWIGLALLGAALMVPMLLARRGLDPRAVHRRDYLAMGLAEPTEWTPEEVRRLLEDLSARLAAAEMDALRAAKRKDLEAEHLKCHEAATRLSERAREAAERLGVAPELDDASLFWLASAVKDLQTASRSRSALEAEAETARRQARGIMARWIERFGPLGIPALAGASDLHGAVESLDGRQNEHMNALAKREAAEKAIRDLEATSQRLMKRRAAVLDELGLATGAERRVEEWCHRLPQYTEARTRRDQAQFRSSEAAQRLQLGFPDEEGLDGRTEADLNEELAREEPVARDWQLHHDEIVGIVKHIELARNAHDLEEALAALDAARETLREEREEVEEAGVGALLAGWVHAQTRDRDRPRVFHEAQAKLLQLTRGRWRLEIGEGDPPSFRAVDTTTGKGHALAELSSGTRLQLLLAVRLAFVEREETGLRLPLILDEALANSDAARAEAIQEALVEIVRSGRQVFCFTAQPDEAARWKELLDARQDVPHRIIDLGRERGLKEPELARHPSPPPRPRAPSAAGMDREEYGRAIGAPPIDPWGEPGEAHIFHVVEDLEELRRLLDLGIERWGQLQSLLEKNGGALLGENGSADRLRARARVLEALLGDFRSGRGRPVDRQAIVDSGAVTDIFLDRVAELAASLGGDARMLLESLEAGKVKRFRQEAIDELRRHLEENGYLAERPPLSLQQLRSTALAAAAEDIASGRIDAAAIDRLLGLFPAPAARG